jgi:hypothetical protein
MAQPLIFSLAWQYKLLLLFKDLPNFTFIILLRPLQNPVKMATVCNLSKKSFEFEKKSLGNGGLKSEVA